MQNIIPCFTRHRQFQAKQASPLSLPFGTMQLWHLHMYKPIHARKKNDCPRFIAGTKKLKRYFLLTT